MARDVNDCRSPPMSIEQRMVQRVVAQFHQPRGLGGRLAGWTMASRASNRNRNVWVVSLLDIAPLPLDPPVVCVLATAPG